MTQESESRQRRPPSGYASRRPDGGRPQRPGGRPVRRFGGPGRNRVCEFCAEKVVVDYKDVGRLRRYLTEGGKIFGRRQTGTCARHQRRLTIALKRARYLALLPYVSRSEA